MEIGAIIGGDRSCSLNSLKGVIWGNLQGTTIRILSGILGV